MQLAVADQGVGIPESIRRQIFTPFFTTKKDVGTGLGLWIVKSMLMRTGGFHPLPQPRRYPRSRWLRYRHDGLPAQRIGPGIPDPGSRLIAPGGSRVFAPIANRL